jgi:hypothetical protein
VSPGAFLGARLGLFLAGVRGTGGGRWRWGLGGSLVVFVLLGRRVGWPPRRVDGLALRLEFVGEWESWGSVVRCGVGRTAWGWRLCLGLGL